MSNLGNDWREHATLAGFNIKDMATELRRHLWENNYPGALLYLDYIIQEAQTLKLILKDNEGAINE